MAITVPNQWPGTGGSLDVEVTAWSTPGRWLIAVIVARVVDGSAPVLALADVARNPWTLLHSDTLAAHAEHGAAQLQAEIWACPSATRDGWAALDVYAAAAQIGADDVGSIGVTILEVAGMGNSTLTVDSVTISAATAASSLTLTAPAPAGAADCLMVAAAAVDAAYASYTATGTGWTQLSSVTRTGPDLGLCGAWREATTGGGVTFALGAGTGNWAGVLAAIRVTGAAPAQVNPAWPATSLQIGLGYDLSTPLPRVVWTDQTSRYLGVATRRGIQAELGTVQQGSADLDLRNDDGAYTPRTVQEQASATAAGTATTIKVADADAEAIHVGDFFRLKTSAGQYKELNVFQVTGLASAAGTTTVTFARADGTPGGALAATATGDLYAGIPIDLYIPWRIVKTVGTGTDARTYVPACGWLRDLSVGWADAHWSEVAAQGADALETMIAASPSSARGEILRRRGLYAYWPLNDPAGSAYGANASGVSNTPLVQTASKWGTGAATTADFGAGTQGVITAPGPPEFSSTLLGDTGTGWRQTGQTRTEISDKGYALVAADQNFPPISGGVTIFGALLSTNAEITEALNATVDPTICIVRNSDPSAGAAGSVIRISVNRTNILPKVTVWDKDTHASSTATVGQIQLPGIEWTTFSLVFDQTTWALYIRSQLSGTGTCDLPAKWSILDIGGEADQFAHGRTLPGIYAHFAVIGRKITAKENFQMWSAVQRGLLDGEVASTRITKKMNSLGWRGARAINPGVDQLSAEGQADQKLADVVAEVGDSEDSLVFIDSLNQVQYRNRVRAHQQIPRATLGEDVAAGEIPYQPGQRFNFNPTLVYNTVRVDNSRAPLFTFTEGVSTSTVVAVDDTSSGRYGPRGLRRDVRYLSDASAWAMAWWWLGRYAYPQMRVGSVTVSAAATSAAARWALVLGVEVGDLLIVKRRAIGQPAITLRCRVLAVGLRLTRRGGAVVAEAELDLAAAPPVVPIVGSSVYGTLAGTVMGA